MNIQFLAALIKANSRIVIPGFGAFLHKENSSIVFSPFLNKDDGLLHAAICKRFSVSAVEAQTQVETFCEDVKESFKKVGKFYIEGIGILVCNENGRISLLEESERVVIPKLESASSFEIPSIDPLLSRRAQVADQRPAQVQVEQPVQPQVQPQVQPVTPIQKPQPIPQPVNSLANNIPRPVSMPMSAQGVNANYGTQTPGQPRPAISRPMAKPQPSWVSPNQPVQQRVTQNPQQGRVSPNQQPGQTQNEPKQMAQRPMQGQPARPNGTQTGQPNSGQNPQQRPVNRQPEPKRRLKKPQQRTERKSKLDIWLLVAILATISVVILIVWGLINTDPATQIY